MSVPLPSPTNPAPAIRRSAVERARQSWVSRLIDLSQRNNLLYYRELRVGSLNLTAADRDGLAALLSGQAVSLAKLCPGEDRVSTAARVKEIARKSRENSEERGLETMSLAAGYATWRGEEGKRPTNAPVLLVPIAVNARERAGPTLSRSGEPQVNPVLQQVLASRFRCQI